MRKINIANYRNRNAQVGFEQPGMRMSVTMRCADGGEYKPVRLLKNSIGTGISRLTAQYGDDLTDLIISGDPEVDMETAGKYLKRVRKVFIAPDGKVAYKVTRQTSFFNPQGEQKSVQKYYTVQANINAAIPLRWTGKLIPKSQAIRQFVFLRKYQIRHINGLTFDFLYDMARQLYESDSLMLIGAGSKGISPLVTST